MKWEVSGVRSKLSGAVWQPGSFGFEATVWFQSWVLDCVIYDDRCSAH